MKALVLKEYNKLVYEDVSDPVPGPDDVLVEVKACGICGSDVHGVDGSTGRRRPPLVMGHEASGIVSETGTEASAWNTGDRVTFDSTVYCGKCWFCRGGRINLCEHRRVLGVSCDEYRQHGAFAEYVSVPRHILYRLPEGVTFEQAAMVEALSIAVHAVARCGAGQGDGAVVVGAGTIGLLIVQVLRDAGCGSIFAVDLDPGRLDLALTLGADHAIKPDSDNAVDYVIRETSGRGADIAFDAVGVTAALQTAIGSLRKGGALTLVGNLVPQVDLPLQAVVSREISVYGSCASNGEYPDCLDMIASGRVNVDALISRTAPLSEGAEWFARLYSKEQGLIKVILQP